MSEFVTVDALTFLSVVDEGSFAAAAKKWYITPSVISKRISRLEQHLQVQLLKRTTRNMTLTESGQLFYRRWQQISAEMNDAIVDVMQHHQHPTGILRINAPMSFGQVHLVPAINDFLRCYPEIQVELILGSQYTEFIHTGLDLTIYIKKVPDTHLLRSRKIATRSTGIYGSPDYFKQHPLPRHPQDLAQHNCLIYQAEPGNTFGSEHHEWVFECKQEKITVPVSGSLRINSSQALVKAAIAGIGLAKVSSFMVTEEVKKGQLISVLDEFCAHNIDIHAVYPSQRYLPLRVRLFIDFLIERFRTEEIRPALAVTRY